MYVLRHLLFFILLADRGLTYIHRRLLFFIFMRKVLEVYLELEKNPTENHGRKIEGSIWASKEKGTLFYIQLVIV